jgi:TRAP transporter 4TM/12TM fusion protein
MEGWLRKAYGLVALGMGVFHLYTALFGIFTPMLQRMLHLAFSLVLIFISTPTGRAHGYRLLRALDLIFALIAIAAAVFVTGNYIALVYRQGAPQGLDIFFGVTTILLILEGTRRGVNWSLSLIAILFLLYAYFGAYFPGVLSHRGYSLNRIVSHVYLSPEGIFGIPLGVSSTYIVIFILFATFLSRSGVGQFFMDIAMAIAGHAVGGPAKVAVVMSGFFGTISGSAAANVVSTGSFTIPMMKKLGYPAAFAGAVEAVASTGGAIMPPVMGAAAFILCEFTGISYAHLIVAAAIPGILYYASVGFQVHLVSKNLGFVGLPRDQLPRLWQVLKRSGYLVFPVLVMLVLLLGYNASPMKAGVYGIMATVLVSLFKAETRLTNISRFIEIVSSGMKSAVTVALACACAGIVVGVTTLTGLGLTLSSIIITLSGGKLWVALVFTMLTSIVLGMGLPPSACYIILAVMVAPALEKMGVAPLAAHMFIFYFGCIAVITPPVAVATYAACGIAESNPIETGFKALKLGIAAFIVPFMFVYGPALLAVGSTGEILIAAFSSLVGVFCLAAAVEGRIIGRIGVLSRIGMFTAAVLLIKPGIDTDAFGLLIFGVVYFVHRFRRRNQGT